MVAICGWGFDGVCELVLLAHCGEVSWGLHDFRADLSRLIESLG
jgi:hypothetical protein